jgi:hypothetical protein
MASLSDVDDAEWRELIEVQTRRYYQFKDLADVRSTDADGGRSVTGLYADAGQTVRVIAVGAPNSSRADLAAALCTITAQIGESASAVADIYVRDLDHAPPDQPQLSVRLASAVAAVALPAELRRVTVSVPTPTGQVARVTFERHGAEFAESPILRDLHPMVADRLHLWRLADFDLRRLPAPVDVYLFEATGRGNPRDRRLMALAELHDLTPLRDGTARDGLPRSQSSSRYSIAAWTASGWRWPTSAPPSRRSGTGSSCTPGR